MTISVYSKYQPKACVGYQSFNIEQRHFNDLIQNSVGKYKSFKPSDTESLTPTLKVYLILCRSLSFHVVF